MDLRILAAVGAVVALLVVVVIPRRLAPKRLFESNHAARLGVENEIRRTIIQMLGGSFVLASVFFTYETVRISQESLRLTERGQITERFTRAIDQIGSGELDVATGGIYALGQIARESKTEYEPIMDILTTYVREHSAESSTRTCRLREAPAADVQAAITVIGERNLDFEAPGAVLDLRGLVLVGTDFSHGNYDRVSFSASCLLDANFEGASLEEADFGPLVERGGAYIEFTSMEEANFTDARAAGASFASAEMFGVTMRGASLLAADLSNARMASASTVNIGLVADLSGADLRDADLEGVKLLGVNLKGANLAGAEVSQGQLERAETDEDTVMP